MNATRRVGAALLLMYLVAWLDRMAINLAMPFIADEFALGADRVGWILSAFFLGYAALQIPGGMLADRFGPRRVILASLAWWSVFTALTGVAGGLASLLAVRVFFGIGEGVFPAAVWKTLSGWFTRKNRATANALVLSSIALGPALTPLILAPILAAWGWRAAFYVLGALGVVCVLVARRTIFDSIETAPNVSQGELAAYRMAAASAAAQDETALAGASFKSLLRTRVVWALFAVGLVFNITMYGWLNWLPSYLVRAKGLELKGMALAAALPFFFGAVGCMTAGWVSDRFFRGKRKRLVVACMLVGGACLFMFTRVDDVVTYMALQCVAGFLLFMACGAVWSLPMVLLPPHVMGVGSGLINTGGQIGGFLANLVVGYYISYRGGDYAAGFDVMLGALALASLIVLFGVDERPKSRVQPSLKETTLDPHTAPVGSLVAGGRTGG